MSDDDETPIARGSVCAACNGSGRMLGEVGPGGVYRTSDSSPCSRCDGSGLMVPHIERVPPMKFVDASAPVLECATCGGRWVVVAPSARFLGNLPARDVDICRACRRGEPHQHAWCPTCSPPGWFGILTSEATTPGHEPRDA